MKIVSCFLLLFFISCTAMAGRWVRGKVIDAGSMQPLEAVTIRDAKNATLTTNTDQFGNFAIEITEETTTLVATYIGYKVSAIAVSANEPIHIALQPDVVNLKEVTLQSNRIAKFKTFAKIDLNLKPVRNTQELLRLVPGLFIAQHAGGGKAEQIFLRGFDCDHGTDIQISVDGMPVNMVSHAHGQGYADAHFIIPETINTIDYGVGPYYAQHGDFNTAGYVAFSTYNQIDKSRVQVEGGNFNTVRTLAMIDLLKKHKEKQSAYIAGEVYYTNGPTIHPQHFNRYNLFGKYYVALTDHSSLIASLSAFKSRWDASGQVPTRAVAAGIIDRFGSIDPTEGGNTERYNANLVLAHTFGNGTIWENQAFFSRYRFNLFSNFTFYLFDPVNGDAINQSESRNICGYQSKISRTNYFDQWSLQSTAAVGWRYDAVDNSKLAHVVKRRFLNDIKKGDIRESNLNAYVEEQAHAGKWLINAGARFDHFSFDYKNALASASLPAQSKNIISPKLSVQYTINQQWQLYIKTGKGFHSNDTRVVVAPNGNTILPAAYGSDIGMIVKPTGRLLLNVAAWYLYLQQEFVYVGDDGNIEPSGETRRTGVDVIARYQFSKDWFANMNINITKPRALHESKGENYIPLAPVATSTGGIYYKRKSGWNGNLSYRYIKDRPANEDNSIIANGYFLLDGAINYTFKKYDVGIAAENILNSKWNEAQFATASRLKNELYPVTELNYTPGNPVFIRLKLAVTF